MVCRLIPMEAAHLRADRPQRRGAVSLLDRPARAAARHRSDGLRQDDDARHDDRLHQRGTASTTSSRSRTRSSTTTRTRQLHRQPARGGGWTSPSLRRGDPPRAARGPGRHPASARCATSRRSPRPSRPPRRATSCSARCTPRAPRAPWTASSTSSRPDQQEMVRVQLSVSLIGVHQPGAHAAGQQVSGMVAGFEIMVMTPGHREPHPEERDLQDPQRHPDRSQPAA